ncbi:MAG: AMP-binding protein [Terriglobia bacterium]
MQNLFERFLASEARFPRRLAAVVQGETQGEEFTYADVRRLADAARGWLHARGIAPGDRCALLAANHPRWCAAFLGVVGQGAVAVPLDTTLKASQIATLLRDAGCRAIFTSNEYVPAVRAAADSCPDLAHIFLLGDLAPPSGGTASSGGTALGGVALPTSPARPDDLAAVFYTSGTTCDPKGVMLTHANLLAEIDAALEVVNLNADDRILAVLPLFHVLAFVANFWLPFAVGASVVFLQSISSAEVQRALREREISAFCVVPQFFYLIHQRIREQVEAAGRLRRWLFQFLLAANGRARALGLNLGPLFFRRVHALFGPRMRLLVSGGSRFDPGVARDLHRLGLTLTQAYGLTETSAAVTFTPLNDFRIGSVGPPLPGVEVKILPAELPLEESDTTPLISKPRASGEIAIRGPIVMRGYYNQPEATAAVFQDGWLRTGDLGYLDSDGHLFITGRIKEVIVLSSGKNIYPEELEAHYATSPYIKELCVLGRTSEPGEPLADRLHAVVVPDFDALRRQKVVNAREIVRYAIESLSLELPSHKRVLSYELWPHELPRTTTRKLKRFEVERALAARARETPAEALAAARELTPEERAWAAESRVARALALIARAARRQPAELHPNANLELDLSLDSMQRIELLVTLEQEFSVEFDTEVTQRIYTVRELVDALLAPSGATPRAAAPQRPAWDTLLTAAPADEPAFSHIHKPKRLVALVLFAAIRILYALARLLLRLRVEGLEHLPRTTGVGGLPRHQPFRENLQGEPFILSPNHQSYLDAFLLCSALPFRTFRQLFFLGASEYYTTRLMRWLARLANIIPVDPDTNLVRAMQAGAFGLRHGKVLILFPEGERSIDGEVKTFKKGAAILSTHLQVPIVPVALAGAYEVWPRGRLPQRLAPVRIRLSAPLPPPPPTAPQSGAEEAESGYARLTAALRDRVVEMFESLRGPRPASKGPA